MLPSQQTYWEPEGHSPHARGASEVFRRSQLVLDSSEGGGMVRSGGGLSRSRSAAALNKLSKPTLQVCLSVRPAGEGRTLGASVWERLKGAGLACFTAAVRPCLLEVSALKPCLLA